MVSYDSILSYIQCKMSDYYFLFRKFFYKEARIVFVGLDNAGKTTLINVMKDNKIVQSEPTQHPVGFDLEMYGLKIRAVDLGGHKEVQDLWRKYYTHLTAIVFIVDASDSSRFGEARKALQHILDTPELRIVPVLILGNKIDRQSSGVHIPSTIELKESLNVATQCTGIASTPAHVRPMELFMCSVLQRTGFKQGFEWLCKKI